MKVEKYVKTTNCVECGMCDRHNLKDAMSMCPYGAIQKVMVEEKEDPRKENEK